MKEDLCTPEYHIISYTVYRGVYIYIWKCVDAIHITDDDEPKHCDLIA